MSLINNTYNYLSFSEKSDVILILKRNFLQHQVVYVPFLVGKGKFPLGGTIGTNIPPPPRPTLHTWLIRLERFICFSFPSIQEKNNKKYKEKKLIHKWFEDVIYRLVQVISRCIEETFKL